MYKFWCFVKNNLGEFQLYCLFTFLLFPFLSGGEKYLQVALVWEQVAFLSEAIDVTKVSVDKASGLAFLQNTMRERLNVPSAWECFPFSFLLSLFPMSHQLIYHTGNILHKNVLLSTSHTLGCLLLKQNTRQQNKCWWGCGSLGTLVPCWWECKVVRTLWKTVWQFLKKLKIELPYDPAIPLLKALRAEFWRNIHTPIFITALLISKMWEQPKCPSVEKWINKMWWLMFVAVCIPTNGILFSLKKEGTSNTGYHIDEPGGYFAEWNKSVIRGQILCDPTWMTYLEKLNSFRQKW